MISLGLSGSCEEIAIAVYDVDGEGITDTGQRIPLSGGPTSIRSQPR
jgi:hypothetical protein